MGTTVTKLHKDVLIAKLGYIRKVIECDITECLMKHSAVCEFHIDEGGLKLKGTIFGLFNSFCIDDRVTIKVNHLGNKIIVNPHVFGHYYQLVLTEEQEALIREYDGIYYKL